MAGEIVKFGDWINAGWKLFTLDMKTWAISALFPLVLLLSIYIFPIIAVYVPLLTGREPNPVLFLLMFPVLIPIGLIMAFLTGGMHRMALKQLRGEKISVRDVFSCTDRIGRLLGAAFLMGIAYCLGFFVFFFGLYVAMALLFFTVPIIVDEDIGVIEAITKSYNMVKRDLLMFTLFVFVVMMIAGIGLNLCLVGFLFTYPLLFTITAVAYRDCFKPEQARIDMLAETRPDTPHIYTEPTAPVETPNRFISNCSNCNAYMPNTAMFCPKCGSKR